MARLAGAPPGPAERNLAPSRRSPGRRLHERPPLDDLGRALRALAESPPNPSHGGRNLELCRLQYRMGTEVSSADHVIERIASAALGTVSREELLAAGVTARQIMRRLESRRLLPAFRGVYRV